MCAAIAWDLKLGKSKGTEWQISYFEKCNLFSINFDQNVNIIKHTGPSHACGALDSKDLSGSRVIDFFFYCQLKSVSEAGKELDPTFN